MIIWSACFGVYLIGSIITNIYLRKHKIGIRYIHTPWNGRIEDDEEQCVYSTFWIVYIIIKLSIKLVKNVRAK